MFWSVAYYLLAIILTLGGAALTLIFMVPEKYAGGWRRKLEINRVRIFGFCVWMVGVWMILSGLRLEGLI
ncbi:hypothetical protein ACFLZW_05365 [Chloroflexota bacterium]